MADGRGESRDAVTLSLRLAIGLLSARARALGARIARVRFLRWRRKDPAELERLRRLDVNRRGRIGAGRVVDLLEPETAGSKSCLVVYSYEVAGVTYEAAQDVTALPEVAAIALLASGRTASVKFDPKRPGNSIIACEEWNGLENRERGIGIREEQFPVGSGHEGDRNPKSKIQNSPSP
jgi:hypothetical protein